MRLLLLLLFSALFFPDTPLPAHSTLLYYFRLDSGAYYRGLVVNHGYEASSSTTYVEVWYNLGETWELDNFYRLRPGELLQEDDLTPRILASEHVLGRLLVASFDAGGSGEKRIGWRVWLPAAVGR